MPLNNDREHLEHPRAEYERDESITGAQLYSRLQRTQKQRNWMLPVLVAGVAITGAAVALTSGRSEGLAEAHAATPAPAARDPLKLARADQAAATPDGASVDVRVEGSPTAALSKPAPQPVRPAPKASTDSARTAEPQDEQVTAAPAAPGQPVNPETPAAPPAALPSGPAEAVPQASPGLEAPTTTPALTGPVPDQPVEPAAPTSPPVLAPVQAEPAADASGSGQVSADASVQ